MSFNLLFFFSNLISSARACKARYILFSALTAPFLFFATACSNAPTYKSIDQLLSTIHWQAQVISTPHLNFMTYAPIATPIKKEKLLYIYMEGDGNAWETRYKPSQNPTPLNPVGLELAIQHPSSNVVYLARACQYLEPALLKNCMPSTWTQQRFSEPVVNATLDAVEQLRVAYNADELVLIGFSGGGTLAAKIAIKAENVVQLVTVAAPLDPDAWVKYHQISSLDHRPITTKELTRLATIPQIHFTGVRDKTVPSILTYEFTNRYPETENVQVIEVNNADHNCCWVQQWQQLSEKFIAKKD